MQFNLLVKGRYARLCISLSRQGSGRIQSKVTNLPDIFGFNTLENLTAAEFVTEFPAFSGTWRVTTNEPHSETLQNLHFSSLISRLILSSNLRLCLWNNFFPLGFYKRCLNFCYLTRANLPSVSFILITIAVFGKACKSRSFLLCSFLHPSVISYLFGRKSYPEHPFSNSLINPRSFPLLWYNFTPI